MFPARLQLAAEVARKQCLSAKAVALLTARVAGQHEAHREVDQECADLRAQARALATHRDALEDQLAAAHQVSPHSRNRHSSAGGVAGRPGEAALCSWTLSPGCPSSCARVI